MVSNWSTLRTARPKQRDLAAFFAALAVTFGTLVVLGHILSGVNYINNFSRLHQYINPSTLYYPTASQVINIAEANAPADTIAVIVGGSSVMWGAGQSNSELWTRQLQIDLGNQYSVVNLALPSGSPEEHGGVAAQFLFKSARKVIFVTDLGANFGPPDGQFFPYVYWDAYYRGYLLDNQAAMPLIARMAGARRTSPPLDELRIRAALDSVLEFTDFWNAFGYSVLFTSWNFLVYPPAGQFFTPRGGFVDPLGTYPPSSRYSSPSFARAMDVVRAYAFTQCPDETDGPSGKDGANLYWIGWETTASAAFPEEFRRNILVARVFEARFYRDALTDAERECYAGSFANVSGRLRRLGYNASESGVDWTPDDYVDVTHPSYSGGVKMAAELAPQIREIARTLGYVG